MLLRLFYLLFQLVESRPLPTRQAAIQLHTSTRLFEQVLVGEMLPSQPDIPTTTTPCFGSELSIIVSPPSYQRITLLHTNDIHAHFDEFNSMGLECKLKDIQHNKCFGGIARISYLVEMYRKTHENVLLVDAGDQFTGTPFFQTFKADIISKWMNAIQYDLMTLGNHEFDRGEAYLGEFIRNVSFPVISSNINIKTAPHLFEAGIKPFVIFPQYRLAIIGYITSSTSDITPAKSIVFYDPISIVQEYVDHLHSMGIRRIICVSHNGYDQDKHLAQQTHGIQLIVGGHSHTLLLNDTTVHGVQGSYPSPVQNKQDKTTYVVQAHRYGDYLGHLDLEFNEEDELVSLMGQPILLDQHIPQDPVFQEQVETYKSAFSSSFSQHVATLADTLHLDACSHNKECRLANLITNSYLEYGERVCQGCFDIAMITVGGLRASLSPGPVSLADIMHVLPFQDDVYTFNMTGVAIRELLESVVAGYSKSHKHLIHYPQFAGLVYSYRPSAPVFHRIESIYIQRNHTRIPLDPHHIYHILASDFVAMGGDAILQPPPASIQPVLNKGSKIPELDLVLHYLAQRNHSLVSVPLDHRIRKIE